MPAAAGRIAAELFFSDAGRCHAAGGGGGDEAVRRPGCSLPAPGCGAGCGTSCGHPVVHRGRAGRNMPTGANRIYTYLLPGKRPGIAAVRKRRRSSWSDSRCGFGGEYQSEALNLLESFGCPVHRRLAVVSQSDNLLRIYGFDAALGTVVPLIPLRSFPLGFHPQRIVALKFSAADAYDGYAVTNMASNTVSLLSGDADGPLSPLGALATCTPPSSIAAADFNGDGTADLVVTCMVNNHVWLHLGNGDGLFQAGASV